MGKSTKDIKEIKMKSKKKIILLCLITILFVVLDMKFGFIPSTYQVQAATITLNRSSMNLVVGNSSTLTIDGTPKKVKWYSANEDIAKVDSNGKITALKAGNTDIYVNISNKKYVCKLTVKDPVLNYKAFNLDIGDTFELQLKGTKGKIKWNSQKSSIASVNSKGKVTAKAPGKVNITASVGNSTFVCRITVNGIEVKQIEIMLQNEYLYQGETAQIETEIYPANATLKAFKFQSSDENIAKVDNKGVITAVNLGTVVIRATFDHGIVDECTIEIISQPILSVRNTTILLGDDKKRIIEKLGQPTRIAKSNYGDETYVYADDYSKLLFLYMKEDKVGGFYTNANDFKFAGVDKQTSDPQETLWNGRYDYDFFVDTLGLNNMDGVFVIDKTININEYTDEVLINMEKEVFDITNSYRVQNGLSPLIWCDVASVSSKKHSEDMAENDYFSHTSLSGASPFDRMKREGITYSTAGENIAAGYITSFHANHGWFQSAGHRKNMLNSKFVNLGVGIATGGSYSIYYTQNFYTKR